MDDTEGARISMKPVEERTWAIPALGFVGWPRTGRLVCFLVGCILGAAAPLWNSYARAQTRLTTESDLVWERSTRSRWVSKQFFVVGIDVRDGHTKWILPQPPLPFERADAEEPVRAGLQDLLLAGYWVQSVSNACPGHEAILVLREP